MNPSAVVLFDADCPACRTLAVWAEARAGEGPLTFQSWQDFAGTATAAAILTPEQRGRPADKLRVLTSAALLEGPAAWEHLVSLHPSLAQITWMARTLGLARPEAKAGRVLEQAGRIVRRLCLRCPRSSAT